MARLSKNYVSRYVGIMARLSNIKIQCTHRTITTFLVAEESNIFWLLFQSICRVTLQGNTMRRSKKLWQQRLIWVISPIETDCC